MLISSQIGKVDTSYVPGLGEEVYDTISGAIYRGNSYDSVSELTNTVQTVTPETIFFLPANNFVAAGSFQTTAGTEVQGASLPADATTELNSFAFRFPVGWTAVDAVAILQTDSSAAEAANIHLGFDLMSVSITTDPDGYDELTSIVPDVVTPNNDDEHFTVDLDSGIPLYNAFDDTDFWVVRFIRYGLNAADVGTQEVGLIGIKFTNAS